MLGASTSTVFAFSEELRMGSTGEAVTELQKRLINQGFMDGEPTAYFGIVTYMGVKRFQDKNGLDHSGIVNTDTRTALNAHQ